VLVTFVLSWFSSWLNQWQFLSFPLGFYMAAQGSLLLYLLLIWIYNRRMHQLDVEYGIDDE
jgi:putative solute:sodium symporter small subunit